MKKIKQFFSSTTPTNPTVEADLKREFARPTALSPKVMLGLALLVIGILLSVIVFCAQSQREATLHALQEVSERQAALLATMTELRNSLETLATQSRVASESNARLIEIAQTLEVLQHTLSEGAKTPDIQRLSKQLTQIQHALQPVSKKSHPRRRTLKRSTAQSLPFRVVSIDAIADQPFVSIEDHHRPMPLCMGDEWRGWRVVRLDAIQGIAEFKNRRNQRLKITVPGFRV